MFPKKKFSAGLIIGSVCPRSLGEGGKEAMIRVYFSAAGLRRIVLDAPSAPGREFDLAALIGIRPYLLAADRTLVQAVSDVLDASKPDER